jgi:RNA polymerase sigma-70 factor (ECF subfamily)
VNSARHYSSSVVAALVENHQRFLSFLKQRVGNPADAEEILQAAFVKGVEKSASIRDDETVISWFYRLLRNAVTDYYRHKNVERRALGRVEEMFDEAKLPDPAIESAICQCVHGLLPTIKAEYGDLLRRVDMDGESVAEVAQAMGRTANNVRVKLRRARKALRTQVELTCGVCAEHACLDCTCRHTR